MNACSSFCLPQGYSYLKMCCKRPYDTQYDENDEKKNWRYILSHSHRGITKVQITATATQAILWLSMLSLLEFKSLVEPRSKPLRKQCSGPATPIIERFLNSHDSVWEVPLSLVILGICGWGWMSWIPVWHSVALIRVCLPLCPMAHHCATQRQKSFVDLQDYPAVQQTISSPDVTATILLTLRTNT